MNAADHFEGWTSVTGINLSKFEPLSEEDLAYWSQFNTWPLDIALFFSMGLRPRISERNVVSQEVGAELGSELMSRIGIAKEACNNGKLTTVASPDTYSDGYFINRSVDVKTFIVWARENYKYNCERLFDAALSLYKSTAHAEAGGRKGKQAVEVKEQITARAIQELEAGCKCNHSDLADYLMALKQEDGSPTFSLIGIKSSRAIEHFIAATTVAFRLKGTPLRNEKKDHPRGRKLCNRHSLT